MSVPSKGKLPRKRVDESKIRSEDYEGESTLGVLSRIRTLSV